MTHPDHLEVGEVTNIYKKRNYLLSSACGLTVQTFLNTGKCNWENTVHLTERS